MQYLKTLRTISLVLAFVLVTFGCATSKNNVINADFELTAEAVPEGILLIFSNIPSDATHLWILVSSGSDDAETETSYNIISSYAGITDVSVQGWVNSTPNLEMVKQTGKVIFPIVQTGIKYNISATVYNENEFYELRGDDVFLNHRIAYTDFTADSGIYFNRDGVKFDLNDTHSFVNISSEPVFSSEVIFADQKYGFGVTILVDNDGRSIGVGEHHFPDGLSQDGLTWTFEPQMTEVLRNDNGGWLEDGSNYTAWGTAYANIIFDDIKWCIEIAKTPEFNFSL